MIARARWWASLAPLGIVLLLSVPAAGDEGRPYVVRFADGARAQAAGLAAPSTSGYARVVLDEAARADLARRPGVLSIEPDHEVRLPAVTRAHALPSDELFSKQWQWRPLGMEDAWSLTRGEGVIVAVIDSGVDVTHPQLAGRLLPGKNWMSGQSATDVTDNMGHGTGVAGVIAAAADSKSIAGLAPGVRILPLKVIDDGTGSLFSIAEAIRYAVDQGAAVINISLGSTATASYLDDAVAYARKKGAVVVASMGNGGDEGNPTYYPGATPGVIGVGAVDDTDVIADFSTYNAATAVTAPGVFIWTIAPKGGVTMASGTSFAAPHVSAEAALIKALDPLLSVDEVSTLVTTHVTDLGPAGRDVRYGHGRVRIGSAVRAVRIPDASSLRGSTALAAGTMLPDLWSETGIVEIPVTVRNLGPRAFSRAGALAVRASYHWLSADGATAVEWDGERTELAADLAPGAETVVALRVRMPSSPGTYRLQPALIVEGVAWFGAATPLPLTVREGFFSAALAPARTTLAGGAGLVATLPVKVTNTSKATWPAAGERPVRLAYHLMRDGAPVVWDGARTLLGGDLAPGASREIALTLALPAETGVYTLQIDLVREGVGWFASRGSAVASTALTVRDGAPFWATYAWETPPPPMVAGEPARAKLKIRNDSLVTWTSGGAAPVRVAVHWYGATGEALVWDGPRSELPGGALAPEGEALVALDLVPPAGAVRLAIDAVQEGVAWYSGRGVRMLETAVRVHPAQRLALYSLAGALPPTFPKERAIMIPVIVRNTGNVTWQPGGDRPVRLAYHLRDGTGAMRTWDGQRTALPSAVAPGASASVDLAVPALAAGTYIVEIDLVHEGVGWFSASGSAPLRLAVHID